MFETENSDDVTMYKRQVIDPAGIKGWRYPWGFIPEKRFSDRLQDLRPEPVV